MNDEQRKADIRVLDLNMSAYIKTMERNESFPFSDAMRRQLPAMLAALRFVEEHGEALSRALGFTRGSSPDGEFDAANDAALESLSRIHPPTPTGAEKP